MEKPNIPNLTEKDNEYDLTVFISCYNEEDYIISAINSVVSAVEELKLSWEIVIIDDVSQDNSVQKVKEYQELHPEQSIILKVNKENRGLAYNFVEAAFIGKGQYFRLVCGDNSESKEVLVNVLQHLGKADIIIPYLTSTGRTVLRDTISRLFTKIVNLLSGYNIKYYNGAAVFRRYHVLRWHSYATGFGFQSDMITRMLVQGISYMQISSWAVEKKHGSSTALNFKNFLSVTHTLLAVLVRRISSWVYRKNHHKPIEINYNQETQREKNA